MAMSTVCVLTPIVVGSWPMISSAIFGAAGALGFVVASGGTEEHRRAGAETRVESEVPNSEVLAGELPRGEKLRIQRDGVLVEFGLDERGRCTVCVSGKKHSKAELRRIGEEVAGRVVQQFAYHKLMTELKSKGYNVVEESVQKDASIQLRVRLGS
jgi:hypothetical protein